MGLGLIGGLGNLFGARKRKREMNALLAQDPRYKINPEAASRLGLAKTLMNARMPGAVTAERNIMASQANQMANINRGATDATQALMLASASQGQTNDAFQQLASQESQDYGNRLQNLTGAQQGWIGEGDKLYNDDVRRWGNKAGALSAQHQNTANSWNSLSNLGFGMMNLGMSGGTKAMFGKGAG
jgi:hypothetical protein